MSNPKRENGLVIKETDYSILDLEHNLDMMELNSQMILRRWPVDYIIHNGNEAYIGQTISIEKRTKQHLKGEDIHFKKKKDAGVAERITIIGQEKFNRSATYNIETNLINNFLGDSRFDSILNKSQTDMTISSDYYDKSYYDQTVFGELWEELRSRGLAEQSLEDISNNDIFKLSPFKALSDSQLELKNQIISFCKQHLKDNNSSIFLINGEAGTGKSVVLSVVFNAIQTLAREKGDNPFSGTNNYLLVNHGEMWKTYKNLAGKLSTLKVKDFDKPTPFLNRMHSRNKKADIVLVDEAHLLLTKEDSYNNFKRDNQLIELMKTSKIVIAVFDPKQVLKIKSKWTTDDMHQIIKHYKNETFELTDQFRMQANKSVVEWIDELVNRRLLPFPKDNHFELKIFDNAGEMHKAVVDKNDSVKLSRVVATFDYPFSTVDKKAHYIKEDDFEYVWNTTDNKLTWAERPETINEVGSIYTVQGFDLNYVGVILGPSVKYDTSLDRIVLDTDKYQDREAFKSRKDMNKFELDKLKEQIILDSMNILMKRGMHGLYIFAHDPALRQRLMELQAEGDK